MSIRVVASAFYLFYYAAAGAVFPYLNRFYQSVGMSTYEIGALAAILTLTMMVAGPLWGGLADALRLHRRLLPLAITLTIIPLLAAPYVQTFIRLALLVGCFAVFIAPIIPLADSAVLAGLGNASSEYGKLRLWGSVGFGLAAWGAGILAEHVGIQAIFGAGALLMAAAALIAVRMPGADLPNAEPFFAGLGRLAANRRWLAFLSAVFLVGMSYSILNNYLVIYLTSLGAGEGLYGLSIAAAGVSELPVMWFSAALLLRLKSSGLLIAAFAAFVLRGLAYSLIADPRWAVAAQLLHGPTFSALWIASVVYAAHIAPRGLGASAQAALGAVLFGLSSGVGALIGAALYEAIGPILMFRVAGGLALLGLALFGFAELRAGRAPVSGAPAEFSG